jgi:D-alanine transaminase
MSRIAYVNGRYLPQTEACVNIEDRGFQFADGVYEVFYVNDGRIIDLALHLARLDRSLRELRITAPMDHKPLLHVLQEVISRNRIGNGLAYLQITRGVARRDHAFPKSTTLPSLVVTVRRVPPYPASVDAWAIRAITQPDQRWARCDIKSVALLPNVLARQAAREQGAGEAILVDGEGMVTEGAATNCWMVDMNGVLRTRPLSGAILPGCTRAALLSLLNDNAIAFEERAFTAAELRHAAEMFITSATSFVKPVIALNGTPIGDGTVGPITSRLFDLFARHVRGGRDNAA